MYYTVEVWLTQTLRSPFIHGWVFVTSSHRSIFLDIMGQAVIEWLSGRSPTMVDWTASLSVIASDSSLHAYEERLSKQPYDLATWLAYLDELDDRLLDAKNTSSDRAVRDLIGRRALERLPRSYKLWKRQWEFLLRWEREDSAVQPMVLEAFERAFLTLSHLPRPWVVYLEWLVEHEEILSATELRRLVNRCLQALPLAQHAKIWPTVIQLLDAWSIIPVESQMRLRQRHAEYTRDQTPLAVYLVDNQCWGAAAGAYRAMLDSPALVDKTDTWVEFLTLCSQHPIEVEASGLDWETIVDQRCEQLVEDHSSVLLGWLWSIRADSWIRRGKFDIARSVYEEGLQRVNKVRDFTILYNAYLQLEESLLEAATESLEGMSEEEEESADAEDWDVLLPSDKPSNKLADMEWAMARAEHLTRRRPLLLNQVMLRQEPNNVGEWIQRAVLYEQNGHDGQASQALEEALTVVSAAKALNGSPSELVTKLVSVYERSSVDKVRDVLDRVCRQHQFRFRAADDLAECWVSWIEFELRQEQYDEALSLARQSVARGAGGKLNLTKSLRLWDLLLDLEESLGTLQTAKDAYNRALEIKAATVQHVLNFAEFLTEHKYFEESFTAFERGIELFPFPHAGAKLLWTAYLKSFLQRYKGTKVERTRDLFQRGTESCPPEDCAEFFLMNGEFEEEHGLTKRALSVYRSMCEKVTKDEKLTAYKLFIAKTTRYLGVTATREIYQVAMEDLDDKSAPLLCMDFCKMETSLQEIERARAILSYGAQMADPRRLPEYWKAWNEFEIAHGNEETFREMLRVKRSVEAAFSTVNYNATGMAEQAGALSNEEAMAMIANQEGVDIDELPKTAVQGFVSSKRTAAVAKLDDVEERVAKLRKATGVESKSNEAVENESGAVDDDEIDIDDIDAEIEAAAAEGAAAEDAAGDVHEVKTKVVPSAVFGGLASKQDPKGALERLRAAKAK